MSAARFAFVGLVLAAAVGVVTMSAGPAAASSGLAINLGQGWVHDSNAPLFDIGAVVPGWSEVRDLHVRNDTTAAARLTLTADGIVEAENSCTHAEAVVDQTCGSDEGELGHALVFSVYVDPEDDGSFENTPRWTGTLYDLTNPAVLGTAVPAHGNWGIRLVSALPHDVGNEVQSDQVSFGLRFGLDGPGSTSSVHVRGTRFLRRPQGAVERLLDALPFTGSPIGRLVAGALWLIIAGAAVRALALVRRREARRSTRSHT